MAYRIECLIIFAFVCVLPTVFALVCAYIDERIALKRRRCAYYKSLEEENKKLRRTICFLRNQAETRYE